MKRTYIAFAKSNREYAVGASITLSKSEVTPSEQKAGFPLRSTRGTICAN
ncbi:MAG: hypothetical protein IJS61_07325 [Firmicutes bacterium]|nr:hypothetical protein [Bacillota bacterium]